MIPSTIHTIWLGGVMPELVRWCVRSQAALTPEWSHIIWDEKMLEAAGYRPDELFRELGSWAAVSNWLRLQLLHRFGGVYLDADVEVIRKIDHLLGVEHYAFASIQDGNRICSAVMGACANHPWVVRQIARWKEFDQRDPASSIYLATAASGGDITIIPTSWVYPFLWDAPPSERRPKPDTLMIHHWLKSWGQKCAIS